MCTVAPACRQGCASILGLDMGLYRSNPCDIKDTGRQRQLVMQNIVGPKTVLFMVAR